MDDGHAPLGRFEVTARLFGIVDRLPQDSQLSLLKELAGEDLTRLLFRLILDMPLGQRQRLLDQLMDVPFEDEPVLTLDLNGDDALLRQMPRTGCELRAICVVGKLTFEGLITDLSTFGMFIRTDRAMPAGEPIRLSFRLPGAERALVVEGDISRREPGGFGLSIRNLKPEHEKAIHRFIESGV
jgi:hypothetical protein